MFSTGVQLALAPSATYRQLVAQNRSIPWWRALARPTLVLLLIGVVVPMTATHEITAGLVLTSAVAWSFVVVIQMAIAAVFVAPAPASVGGFWRSMDLWFAGHLPYSIWILLLPFLTSSPVVPPYDVLGVSMVAPLVWTGVITSAFFRTVLGKDASTARRLAVLHAVTVIIVVSALGLWAAGGTSSTLSYLVRRWHELWS